MVLKYCHRIFVNIYLSQAKCAGNYPDKVDLLKKNYSSR